MKTSIPKQMAEHRSEYQRKKLELRLRGWKWPVNVVKQYKRKPATIHHGLHGVGLVIDGVFEIWTEDKTNPCFNVADIDRMVEICRGTGPFGSLLLILLKP